MSEEDNKDDIADVDKKAVSEDNVKADKSVNDLNPNEEKDSKADKVEKK